jgi:predicted nucleotidyltransferase
MSSIHDIFGSKGCMRVLHIFLSRPSVERYQSEAVKESGLSYVTATKCLDLLLKNDMLTDTWKGGLRIYRLNKESLAVKQMKILLSSTTINDAIKDFTSPDFEVFIYGSMARGEDTEESDVDLLVLGEISAGRLVKLVKAVEKVIGHEVKPVVMSRIEYAELPQKNSAFYENLNRDRIRII